MKSSKNVIPEGILSNFLEYNIGLGLKKKVKTDCNFLWNKDDLERYRIDIWTEINFFFFLFVSAMRLINFFLFINLQSFILKQTLNL